MVPVREVSAQVVLFVLGFSSAFLRAEAPAAGAPSQPSYSDRAIEVIDKDFFNPKKKETEKTTKGPLTETERYVSGEADYNTEQRERWMQKCGPMKETDLKGYRDCFESEKTKELQSVQERIQRRGDKGLNTAGTESKITIPLLDDNSRQPAVDDGGLGDKD